MPTARWSRRQLTAARTALLATLAGVGDPHTPEHTETGELAVHVRRVTTPAEEVRVRFARAARVSR